MLLIIENPRSSKLWNFDPLLEVINKYHLMHVTFAHCMHGGNRDKVSLLCHNIPTLQDMQAACDKQHQHAGFHRARGSDLLIAMSLPALCCRRMAQRVAEHLVCLGVPVHPFPDSSAKFKERAHATAAASRQPGGRKVPSLINEHKRIMHIFLDTSDDISFANAWNHRLPQPHFLAGHHLPKGTKCLDSIQVQDGRGKVRHRISVSLPFSENEFLEQAKMLHHPFDDMVAIADELVQIVFWVLSNDPDKVMSSRKLVLDRVLKRAFELDAKEMEFHNALPSELQRILKGTEDLAPWRVAQRNRPR